MRDPEWITELEELRAKATQGTWRALDVGVDTADVQTEDGGGVFQDSEGILGCGDLADAQYVSALHNALPHLLALIRSRQSDTDTVEIRDGFGRVLTTREAKL